MQRIFNLCIWCKDSIFDLVIRSTNWEKAYNHFNRCKQNKTNCWQNWTPIVIKNSPESGHRENLPQHVLSLVAPSCLTLCNPVDCSPPGSSVHGYSPDKNAGVGCHAFLQGVFPTQGSNPGLLYCRQILYHLSHQGSQ